MKYKYAFKLKMRLKYLTAKHRASFISSSHFLLAHLKECYVKRRRVRRVPNIFTKAPNSDFIVRQHWIYNQRSCPIIQNSQ